MAVSRRWKQGRIVFEISGESSTKGLGQLLLFVPSLAVVGYVLGAFTVALQAANSGLPIVAIIDAQSASQLLATGFLTLSPGVLVLVAAATVLASMFSDKLHLRPSSRAPISWSTTPYGWKKRLTRLVFGLVVVAGLLLGPISVPVGLVLMAIAAVWLVATAFTRTSWSIVDLLAIASVYLFVAGIGYSFILVSTTRQSWPTAKLTADKTDQEFGLVGTNSGVATLVSCTPRKPGFSGEPEVHYEPVENITVLDGSFQLNPHHSENLLSLLTPWTEGRENDHTKFDDLC